MTRHALTPCCCSRTSSVRLGHIPRDDKAGRSSSLRTSGRSKHDATHTESLLEVVQRPGACSPGPRTLSHHTGPRASRRDNRGISRSHSTSLNADWDDPSHCPLHPSTGPSADAPTSAYPSADSAAGSTLVKAFPRRTPRRDTPPPGRSHDREPERLGESTVEPLPRCYASPARAGCRFLILNQLGKEQLRQVNQRLDEVQRDFVRSKEEVVETTKGGSPFAPEILDKPIPSSFRLPTLEPYNGSIDPTEHVAAFRAQMALYDTSDALMTPNPIRAKIGGRDKRRYCHFHRDYGHDTEECNDLRNQIEDLIRQRHLHRFILDQRASEEWPRRDRNPSPRLDRPIEKQIDVIVGGPTSGGDSSSTRAVLPVTVGEEPRSKILLVSFIVVALPSAYNAIIGKPRLNKLRAVDSMYYRIMKFPTRAGVGEVRSDPGESRQCYLTATTLPKKLKASPSTYGVRDSSKVSLKP
ncbi:hypothetical protein B296_00029164 [Ensete ventricosum]|uniref:Reverse transcriptase domain-containing protein n=1 Tax=Ensete ventricosum TaxID=4639 RepID=A0A426YFV6_ENSVE|nr:hypothetical protein B296_00029164 [Ensete ventricosum]